MATKRRHSQISTDSPHDVHPSRKPFFPSATPTRRKRNRADDAGPTSINPLKKRVRDLTRLLEHADSMPADARMENERALSAHKQELAAAEMARLKATLSKRYHMVKFFERRKVNRRLNQIRKRLSAATSPLETASLQNQLHIAEVDLNYILHYPAHRKYIGLYHNDGGEEAKRDAQHWHDMREKGEPDIWGEIERRMATQTLLDDWGDGTEGADRGLGLGKKTKKTREPRKADKAIYIREAKTPEDESDGGFFEE
ncbi:MAG: 18S rRNA maturation protein [Geoglossum simile]|nr:MAG: 18S rRNA maturation protein [Geoglossum simile]